MPCWERLDIPGGSGVPKARVRSVFEVLQVESDDYQARDNPLQPSIVVAVVVAQPIDLLWEGVFAGLGVAPRATFVRDVRAF